MMRFLTTIVSQSAGLSGKTKEGRQEGLLGNGENIEKQIEMKMIRMQRLD